MTTNDGDTKRTFERLGREQLDIYARELGEHVREEGSLRRELEEHNRVLEQRM